MNQPVSDMDARLKVVLAEVVDSIETLLLSGLTSASPSITDKFQNAFEHAAKCQQLRLSSNLRLVNQELKRFFDDDDRFSERRLSLFLNRCWQMSREIALHQDKAKESSDVPNTTVAVEQLKVAVHGVIKKTAPGVFCALEFRLRRIDKGPVIDDKPLLWSCILATPGDSKITPESLLSLDQPQKFKPSIFLDSVVTMRNVRLLEDDTAHRIQLNQDSEVVVADDEVPLSSIDNPQHWSLEKLLDRVQGWEPTPLDLETQPQFEIYLDSWSIEKEFIHPALDNKVLFPLRSSSRQLYMVIDSTDDGRGQLSYFRDRLNENNSAAVDLMFGLLHFEQGIGLFHPLTLWPADQPPVHLMITEDQSNYAALLKILK